MLSLSPWSVVLIGALLLSACVADRPHQNGHAATPVDVQDGAAYKLAYVEFDDQGWFHDIRQRQALFEQLQDLSSQKRPMLIVTYTHGWKHNARADDSNLSSFRQLLAELAAVERAAKGSGEARAVVGIYIGWRGASTSVPVLDNLTFWTRKNAAERVGTRSVKQLFVELNQFRVMANNWDNADQLAKNHETQLIFVGHSFGGLITYHALYSSILERGLAVHRSGNYRVAKSFGDFVLLVNPAFEGAAYEPIWQAAQTRGCYPPAQKPVMAIVTSSADHATRYAFPAGRLYTYTQSATLPDERDAVMHTVGHLERYRTHRLELSATAPPGQERAAAIPTQLAQAAQPNAQSSTTIGEYQLVKTATNAPPRMPYLVIQAGPELISDHNDFWNERFRDFTVKFITSQVIAPFPDPARAPNPPGALDLECPAFSRR